jgi:carbonic anhydrase/acetyltransferase-like protein (isoleucine patch superfamily)
MTHFPQEGLMSPAPGGAWIAQGAVVTGDVTLGEDANVWFGCVLRGDDAPLLIGPRSNVQDGTIVHADPGVPNRIGADVTIGHRCVLHGAEVEDRCLIGMGAILLGGSRIGAGSIVGAGALVKENAVIPPRSLVVGVPARVVREVTQEEYDHLLEHAAGYVEAVRRYLPR